MAALKVHRKPLFLAIFLRFFWKHVDARCQKPSNPIKSHQIPACHHISFHIISSHIPRIKLETAVSAAESAEAAEAASTVPLHDFASWNLFGEHPPYRIGTPDWRQFLGSIKWQRSRSTRNPIKSHQIPSNHHISSHIISHHIITYHHYKIRDCCFCSWGCWGCFYSAFACLCLVGSCCRARPYRIGAHDRRQFLGTIKWQPSRSTQNLTFVWHLLCFFLEACRSTM